MAMKKRTLWRVVLVVIACAWLGWNFLPGRHQPRAKASQAPAVAASTPARASSVAPAPPATWKLGSVTLHACTIGGVAHGDPGASVRAWCAHFEVPEDRTHPHKRHIKLKLAIVRSASQTADPDMVVMLAGGPGEAATHFAHVARMFPRLHRHHDFLLLDQRGTGGSNPLTCKVKSPPALHAFDPTRIRRKAKACLQQVDQHADPRFYTTTAAVADLAAVRKALGSPKFDLIGVSYGTRMALHYLRAHPGSVRSVVLDSPLPNQVVFGENAARNLQRALVKDFALCTQDAACHKRFGDPMHTLALLRQALAANPHMVSTRDPWTFKPTQQPLTADTLASVVRLFAYSRATIKLLPLTLDAAGHGDVGPLLGQYAQLKQSLSGKHLARGMNWSVVCSGDAGLLHPRKADAGTLLGNRLIKTMQAICSVWPHGRRPTNFHQPGSSNKPVLIFSGALDPVTPPAYGKMILKHLGDARQIVVTGEGHGLIEVPCARRIMGQFIRTLALDTLDTGCLQRFRPPTPFINFNGTAS